MRKSKAYRRMRFSAETIREAVAECERQCPGKVVSPFPIVDLSVKDEDAEWNYDSEDEFYGAYRNGPRMAHLRKDWGKVSIGVAYYHALRETNVHVSGVDRGMIERVFGVFEARVDESRIPKDAEEEESSEEMVVFVGHGRDEGWRDLKDHLQDKHGMTVEAYEMGARAGHAIRDVLQGMLGRSSFAVLVMTGEDETSGGDLRARQNVVHEAGLFQGKLGFERAIVLVEEGVEVLSNFAGIQQLRFGKGRIAETFGDVVATIRREFG